MVRNTRIHRAHSTLGPHLPVKRLWANLKAKGFNGSPVSDVVPAGISLDKLNAEFLNVPQCDVNAISGTIDRLGAAGTPAREPLYLKPVGVDEIRGLLTSITTQAEGVEGISVNMPKMIGDAVMPALEDIVNLSLNNSVSPRLWTKAMVTPIPKVANPASPSDLGPINV